MVSVAEAAGAGKGGRRQAARAEAALWVVRSHGRRADDDESLDAWLAADPENIDAWGETTAIWDELGQILPDWKRDNAPAAKPKRDLRRIFAPVAVLACTLLLCLVGWQWYDAPTLYRTGVGEQRIVTLADGSQVTLNTDTELAVERPGRERRLRLVRGEALFNVTHDPTHPFVVEASGRYIRDVGTSFIVRREGERLAVTLLSGIVDIARADAAIAPVRLAPGDRYSDGQGKQGVLDRPRLDVVTAWRNGEMLLDDTPLAGAVAEMNRYRTTPIRLADAGLNDLRLSGVFRTSDSDGFADTAGMIFGLGVDRRPDGIVLVRRKR